MNGMRCGLAAISAAALLCAALGGCGGGGGSSQPAGSVPPPSSDQPVPPPPPAPTVGISVAPTTVYQNQPATLTWSSANATSCVASGAWSGPQATSSSRTVNQAVAGTYTYTLACTGAGGTATASTALTVSAAAANSVPVIVDGGVPGGPRTFNVPFVSVTVCAPGSSQCVTVGHVLVDTGSIGLRLLASALGPSVTLPAVSTSNGQAIAECGQFADGFTWGSVRSADIRMAGEAALAMSLQVIGDTGAPYATVPGDCSSTGANHSTLAALGANGILGVGLMIQDCGSYCAGFVLPGSYYACTASGCTGSTLATAKQVSNPVAFFAGDNNGVVLQLPQVGQGGASNVAGTLVFGIGTQGNNAMGSVSVYATDASGYITTTFNGSSMPASFIDSGSNGLYFADPSLPSCKYSSGFYCPPSPVSLSADDRAANGAAATVPFTVVAIDNLPASATAGPVAGGAVSVSKGQSSFDWGLPFFFGRTVFVAIEAGSTPGGAGPYWAF